MISEKEQLKSDLQKIRESKYELSQRELADDYAALMLKYIGDTDAELRDDLIYETFCEWICVKKYFSREELIYILSVLMDERHLFYHIGSDEDDTVFTRTFSVLVIVLILSEHRKNAFLEYDIFTRIKNNLIRYYREEKDLRGFTGKSGWAHGAAHGADAMDELVQCSESDEEMYMEILDAIKKVLFNGKYIFCNEEDERITRVIFRIIKENHMSCKSLSAWLDQLTQYCSQVKDRKQYAARINTKNFIRCLYFKLMHYDSTLDIIKIIFKAEEKLNHFLVVDKELLQK